MNVADRYFDKTECMKIDLSENPQKAFFDFWSLKESAIKCDGRGVEILSDTHVLLSEY
jgi:phosphopantetheinyl transferase